MVARTRNGVPARHLFRPRTFAVLVGLFPLAACGTLPPSPVGTEAFQKQEQALHIRLSWNCRPVDAGRLLIEGVVEDTDRAEPILGLRFSATSYDKDGRRLTHAVGFPDGLSIGYEGWARFRVLVPGGQAAARVDLGYEYHLPPDNGDRPITFLRPGFFTLAASRDYFGTVQDACRP